MDQKTVLRNYLQTAREALLWKLDGLSEYDVRHPLTGTGTNLLGLVKHVASVEVGYFTEIFGRPLGVELPWFGPDAAPNADFWAMPEETRADIVGLYHRSWELSDATIAELDLDAVGEVPWWPEERRQVTLLQILVHMIAETNRHAGHADIVRELIDGGVGHRQAVSNMWQSDEADYWPAHVAQVEAAARAAT